MEAYEFKSYILGLIFYRYLSDKVEKCAADLLKDDKEDYSSAWEKEDYCQALRTEIIDILGYIIEPEHLFSSLIKKIIAQDFDIEALQKAISAISESSLGTESQEDFENLFDDMDLASSKLGRDVKSRSSVMAKVMLSINDLDLQFEDAEIDVLGDAYEYLIGMFAQTAGKKAGEFYTPQQVSKILAKIVSLGKKELLSVYDPCCGSASLMLRVGKECKVTKYFGQEITATTFNLARMNMLLHGIPYQYFHIANDDTLTRPAFEGQTFKAIVSNPPYSAKWSSDQAFLNDERFSGYGRLAPASKADFAFVCHMINYLDENGTMAVVLPHGVLFRGASEEAIRKVLMKDMNYLDAVIGLPANLFYGTSIPTCILIFKKIRNGNADNILF
ncbi:MAG: type I restriction-modification system subunit M, partial [Anaerovoracaceae bacterium]